MPSLLLQPAGFDPALLRERLRGLGQVVAALAASGIAGALITTGGGIGLAVGALVGVALLAFGMLRPGLFLLVFVFARPVLDDLSSLLPMLPTAAVEANYGGALGAALIALTVVMLVGSREVVWTPSAWALTAVAVVSAASAFQSVYDFGPTVGAKPVTDLVRVCALLAVYLFAFNVAGSPRRAVAVFAVAGLSAVLPALTAIRELILGTQIVGNDGLVRVSGTFTGPTSLGVFLGLAALVLVGVRRDVLPTWVRVAALVPVLTGLVVTYTRAGWVAFLLGLLILEWRQRKSLVIGITVAVAIVVATVPGVQARVLPADNPSGSSEATFESYGWRTDNWRDLLIKWTERPWTGYGLATTTVVNPRRPYLSQGIDDGGYAAHNSIVRVLVEGGVFLLVPFLAFAAIVMRRVRQLARTEWELQPLARIVAAMWIVLFVIAVATDDPFGETTSMALVLALTGCLEGAYRAAHRLHPPREPHLA